MPELPESTQGDMMIANASLLYDLVPRSLFWYLLLAALFLFTCDKCNLFSAAPNASLSDFNKQASNRRGVVHKNLSSSPFIRLTPVPKRVIISKRAGTGTQTGVGYSTSLCWWERMLRACVPVAHLQQRVWGAAGGPVLC